MTLLATQITDALAAQMATCTAANGYVSNVGRLVLTAQTRAGAVQCPCCVVVPGRTTDQSAYSDVIELTRSYEIRGFADTLSHPALSDAALVDLIGWDIRTCLAAAGTALSDLIRILTVRDETPGYREDGGSMVGATVSVGIEYAVAMSDPSTPV